MGPAIRSDVAKLNVHGSGLVPHLNVPPRLRTNPARSISSRNPSIAHTPWMVAGNSDSPIWYRGKVSLSSSSTR